MRVKPQWIFTIPCELRLRIQAPLDYSRAHENGSTILFNPPEADKGSITWASPQACINVSKISKLSGMRVCLMEQITSRPNGVMEWWNIGMLIFKGNYLIS